MRVLIATLAVAVCITPVSAQNPAADETAVRGTVTALTNAINKRDAVSYSALFAADADVIVIDGPRAAGRAAIEAAAAKDWAAAPNERATITPTEIRFVGPDIAIVNTVARFAGGAITSEDRGTWVLHRESGRWLISGLRVMPAAKR
jgi:uncharacterized protein (TIGR02246 family)